MPSMDDLQRLEAKGLARAKIRSRRRRVATIRSRTVRGSLALFAIFWAVIFGQLATGNDPALSRGSHRRAVAVRETEAIAPPSQGGTTAGAPPEPESEAEVETELEREREFAGEPEFGSEAEFEPEPEFERGVEPAPLVTASS
jgi:hypothetical protein